MKNMEIGTTQKVCYEGVERGLFHPRFVVPIPSALYHPARIRVDISLISPQFSWRVISLKNVLKSLKNGLISVKRRMISPAPV